MPRSNTFILLFCLALNISWRGDLKRKPKPVPKTTAFYFGYDIIGIIYTFENKKQRKDPITFPDI